MARRLPEDDLHVLDTYMQLTTITAGSEHSDSLRWQLHLPPLATSAAHELRDMVLEAIRGRDGAMLSDLLNECHVFRSEVAMRNIWLPMALGLDAWSASGETLANSEELSQTIRRHTRQALLALPALPVSRWLVPATPHDVTSTHVAALALAIRGLGTSIWMWPLPAPGPTLIVGDTGFNMDSQGYIPTRSHIPGWPALAALVA
jgi:hypothetical protein